MRSTISFFAVAVFAAVASGCELDSNLETTFYGWPDNDPPSAQVAHNCGGRNYVAGGSGTYADPLTFATAPGEFSPCEIVYFPLLKKYIRYEDDCAECTSDFKSGKKHIDIWTGSSTSSGGQKQIDCEDSLTSGGRYEVVRQPPQGMEVDATPLFADGKCNTGAVFESNRGSCSGGSGNVTEPVASSAAAPSATSTKKHKSHKTAAPKNDISKA